MDMLHFTPYVCWRSLNKLTLFQIQLCYTGIRLVSLVMVGELRGGGTLGPAARQVAARTTSRATRTAAQKLVPSNLEQAGGVAGRRVRPI